MKLIPVVYFGFTALDRRFSSPMLPWIVSEIRKRDFAEKISLGVEDGTVQAYNQDFELQFSHIISRMIRFSQADLDACTFLYLLRDDDDKLLYCYLFQAQTTSDVLHVIDRVLDPINFYNFSPTAYDVISRSLQWRDYSTTYFAQKVNQLHLKSLFNESGRNTYFVPLDAGFDDHRSKMLDKYTIQGHIVRNQVLFTRPTQKNQLYETTADGDYIQILLSFVEQHGKLHVKSYTVLGDSTHPKGDLVAEVVLGNIPVENGVVHLISRPLAVFDRTLKPMPFLPMMSKVEGDLRLNYSYWIGQESGFNEILRDENRSLTYFVPSDFAWRNFWLRGWERNETDLEVLKRHLVIGQKAYTMEELLNLSSEANSSGITLKTLSGLINLSVVKEDGEYYVVWLKAKIPVFRKDYICTNGVVHIINFPFFPTTYYKVNDKDSFNFWAFLKNVVGTVNS